MKKFKRITAMLLAVCMMIFTPVSDYFYTQTITAYASGGVVTTVARWIWAAILAACGVTVDDESALDSLSADIVQWCKGIGKPNEYLQFFEAIASYEWGQKVEHMSEMIQTVKEYFKAKDGYATDTGLSIVPITTASGIVDFNAMKLGYLSPYYNENNAGYIVFRLKHMYYVALFAEGMYPFIYYPLEEKDSFYVTSRFIKDGVYGGNSIWQYSFDNWDNALDFLFTGDVSLCCEKNSSTASIGASNVNVGFSDYYIYYSTADVRAYETNNVVFTANIDFESGYIGSNKDVTVGSNIDVQQRDIVSVGGMTIPADAATAEQLYAHCLASGDSVALTDALAPSISITYSDKVNEGEKDDTYPWVPDITGALDGIKDVINSVKEHVSAIPDALKGIGSTLTDIKDGILAIPGNIADFFTIDKSVVSLSMAGLISAFTAKFEPITQLSGIWDNISYKLNSTLPVMTMDIPPGLVPMFGTDKIIVFDLTPYADYINNIRMLIQCVVWISFIFAVVSHFDVDFTVG